MIGIGDGGRRDRERGEFEVSVRVPSSHRPESGISVLTLLCMLMSNRLKNLIIDSKFVRKEMKFSFINFMKWIYIYKLTFP